MIAFPKPQRKDRKNKKPTRKLDPEYVKWIHGYACVVCGNWPVHAHHVKSKGAGGSDRTVIPLCHSHHTGDLGIHFLGRLHFQAQFRLELEQLVAHFNELYEDGATGPHYRKIAKLNVIK
jgi:hypothetical protein